MFGHRLGLLFCLKSNQTTFGRTLSPQGASRFPGLPAAPLRSASGRPGKRQSRETVFTDEMLHYLLRCLGCYYYGFSLFPVELIRDGARSAVAEACRQLIRDTTPYVLVERALCWGAIVGLFLALRA